ncbi:hypothetical protein [Rhodococcus koreensis]
MTLHSNVARQARACLVTRAREAGAGLPVAPCPRCSHAGVAR